MDATRHDAASHLGHRSDGEPSFGPPRRSRIAVLAVAIGLVAMTGGIAIGAGLGGSSHDDPEPVSAGATTSTTAESTTTTSVIGVDSAESDSGSAPAPDDPAPEPAPEPEPEPGDPDPGDPEEGDPDPNDPDPGDPEEGEGPDITITTVGPGLFVPQLTFDEVIDMGSGTSAEWTLTNDTPSDVTWHIKGGFGLSFVSPDADENWLYGPGGVLAAGESITITVARTSPPTGTWKYELTLQHGDFEDEVTVTGTKPMQILPAP